MNRWLFACLLPLLYISAGNLFAVEYQFINIADTTTTAPSGTFTEFDLPAISGDRVAFRGRFAGASQYGIFTGSGGPVTTIVKSGDPGPVGTFGFYGSAAMVNDVVAFKGLLNDVMQTSGIFSGSGGSLTTIALENNPAPKGTFIGFGDPSVSQESVAFWGRYDAGDTVHGGIFTGSGGPLSSIVKTGDTAPIGTFTAFSDPAISGGIVAFHGDYVDQQSGESGQGVFTHGNGAITPVAKLGDAGPFGAFTGIADQVAISDGGVAFYASYTDDVNSAAGILTSGEGNSFTPIALVGDAAPFGTFFDFTCFSAGRDAVAFSAQYAEIDDEGELMLGNGIFIGNGGPITTVIKNGDALFGSTVENLGFGRFGLDANGSGNLGFQYLLEDGRHGAALARFVPEPSAFCLCCFALFGSCSLARVRHSPMT